MIYATMVVILNILANHEHWITVIGDYSFCLFMTQSVKASTQVQMCSPTVIFICTNHLAPSHLTHISAEVMETYK